MTSTLHDLHRGERIKYQGAPQGDKTPHVRGGGYTNTFHGLGGNFGVQPGCCAAQCRTPALCLCCLLYLDSAALPAPMSPVSVISKVAEAAKGAFAPGTAVFASTAEESAPDGVPFEVFRHSR